MRNGEAQFSIESGRMTANLRGHAQNNEHCNLDRSPKR